jgi:hypothetical protein
VRLNSAGAPACNTLQVYQLLPSATALVITCWNYWLPGSDLAVTIVDDSIDSDPMSDVIATTVRALR